MSYKSVLLSILSAILLILAFPKPELEFLAWFALVPWLFALQTERERRRPIEVFLLSYLVGLVFFSGIVYWVNYVSGLGFSVLVLYLGLYFAVFGLFFSLNPKASTKINLLLLPCIWVGLEYVRSHLFTGFGWALLGYSQYRTLPVIQFSDITGAYGVSFLLVLVNVGLWQVINIFLETRNQKPSPFAKASGDSPPKLKAEALKFRRTETRRKIFFPVLCSLFSVILVLSYGYFRLSQQHAGTRIKIGVVQGNIPQQMKWDPQAREYILKRYLYLTERAAGKQPRIILWPETSVPGYLENDSELFEEIASLSRKTPQSYLLIGTPHQGENGKTYNSATLIFRGKIVQRYDKLHLVPFGEFIPGREFLSRFSFAGLIGDFSPGKDYTVFSLTDIEPEVKFSALICFEDVFAHLARGFVQKGAEILVNMTNDAWFKDSSEPYQHLQASVFRAVENRVNLVRSANTGVSCFISPWGEILSRVSDYRGRDVLVQGEQTQELRTVSMPSFYTAFGDVFAWLCLIITSISIAKRAIFRPNY